MDLTKLLNNLQHNHFETSYFESKGEAAAYLNEKIDAKTVGLGDSLTLKALGLFNLLSTHNQVVDVRHNPVPGNRPSSKIETGIPELEAV